MFELRQSQVFVEYNLKTMSSTLLLWIVLALMFLAQTPQRCGGQLEEEWCIADEQTPDAELQMALNWACQVGGADCSKIQENQACYLPNTLQHHASYAFNNYYQKLKQQGGTCYFNAAAFVTALDPSHNSCKFEYLP